MAKGGAFSKGICSPGDRRKATQTQPAPPRLTKTRQFCQGLRIGNGKAGQLAAVVIGADTMILANVTGDSKADLRICLAGPMTLILADFIL